MKKFSKYVYMAVDNHLQYLKDSLKEEVFGSPRSVGNRLLMARLEFERSKLELETTQAEYDEITKAYQTAKDDLAAVFSMLSDEDQAALVEMKLREE